MTQTRLSRQVYPPFAAILAGAVLAAALLAMQLYGAHFRHRFEADLGRHARLARTILEDALQPGGRSDLDALCRELARTASARITVIRPSGEVLADSELPAAARENHGDRPEVRAALEGQTGQEIRHSFTLQKRMIYVALPLREGDRIVGVVRLAAPVDVPSEALRATRYRLAVGALVVAALAVGVGYLVFRRVARPLESIRREAERYARGDLARRLPVPEPHGLGEIAQAMNEMRAQLEERMQAVLRQRNELEGVLSSMVEAVVAFDTDQRIINLNRAAAELFDVGAAGAAGRSVQEVLRNPDVQRLIRQTLASRVPLEGEVTVHRRGERVLQAHGTPLRDGSGRQIGGLLVLNDITRLRRLENARRDFAANVSHEIRTPLTSITGYVETLLDGALDDRDDARRFLDIIRSQADRLNNLVDDLLELARIEGEEEREAPAHEPVRLRKLLENAVQTCAVGAAAKSIRVDIACREDATARINEALIGQAVVNLLDNAIQYSTPGSSVEIEAEVADGEAVIRVRDHGCGIEPDHIPRLFERFYRVDPARSRKRGGTGLGLAIVKHIVGMHGGRIDVESAPGRGSVFTLHLPANGSKPPPTDGVR